MMPRARARGVSLTIPQELIKYSPFFHDIDLGGGFNTAPEIYRIRFAEIFFFPTLVKLFGGDLKGLKVLDVGCNCGGFSFLAARRGAQVVGIDSDKNNIHQANMIKEYLGMSDKQVKFLAGTIETFDLQKAGEYDITIFAGILYHLSDPIGTMKKVAYATKTAIVVDSHVHYSPTNEDIPTWWMLSDMDVGDQDGLRDNDGFLSREIYREFEKTHSVDYELLQERFIPSPHTVRDMEFVKECLPHPKEGSKRSYAIGSAIASDLSMIPNKKAIHKLIRRYGFEDILELVPPRFSPIPYLKKIRIGLIGLRRIPAKDLSTVD